MSRIMTDFSSDITGLPVHYPLHDLAKRIGVADWRTSLPQSQPATLKGSRPSIEEIEAELGSEES
jgi:hypothetical protein